MSTKIKRDVEATVEVNQVLLVQSPLLVVTRVSPLRIVNVLDKVAILL